MRLYCGIDLHSNNNVVSVLDEQDSVVFERRLPNELERVVEALSSCQAALTLPARESEATGGSPRKRRGETV